MSDSAFAKQDRDVYEIEAVYTVDKTMTVFVAKGDDPMVPSNWIDVDDEHDFDCRLYDIQSVRVKADG